MLETVLVHVMEEVASGKGDGGESQYRLPCTELNPLTKYLYN